MRSAAALCYKSFVDREAHWSNCKVHLHDTATTTLSATTNCKYPSTHASWRLAIEWHSRVDSCEQWQREEDKTVSLPLPSSSSTLPFLFLLRRRRHAHRLAVEIIAAPTESNYTRRVRGHVPFSLRTCPLVILGVLGNCER